MGCCFRCCSQGFLLLDHLPSSFSSFSSPSASIVFLKESLSLLPFLPPPVSSSLHYDSNDGNDSYDSNQIQSENIFARIRMTLFLYPFFLFFNIFLYLSPMKTLSFRTTTATEEVYTTSSSSFSSFFSFLFFFLWNVLSLGPAVGGLVFLVLFVKKISQK